LNEWIKTSNYTYNKGISYINKGDKVNFINLRDKCVTNNTKKTNIQYSILIENIRNLNKKIKQENESTELKLQLIIEKNKLKEIKFENNALVKEWELKTPKAIRDSSIRDICKANVTGWSNLKAGNISHFKLGFRKIKKCKKSFVLPSSLIKNIDGEFIIAPDFLKEKCKFKMGKKTIKKHKTLQINNDCRIIHERNKYWIAIPVPVPVPKISLDEKSINYCGIDPGVRTFLTCFGNEVVEYNQNKTVLKKLNKKIDILKLQRTKKKCKYKIEERKENIINELHWKCINNILKRNDYVFYGDIKSHDIVKKSNNRFLNRDINDLKFYKFKERLMYKASVLKKRVFSVNEMYTTKTCSNCGNLNNVGKREIYECENCKKTLLRDVSAAKNILMKGIVKYL
jgi:transposase